VKRADGVSDVEIVDDWCTVVLVVDVAGDLMISTYLLIRWSGRMPRMLSECSGRQLILAHPSTGRCRIILADPEGKKTRTAPLIELC
jgi:hypothetical protein